MLKSLTIGSSPVATVTLDLVSVEAAQATFTLNLHHTSTDTRNVNADLFDEAGAFGEDPGGPSRIRLVLNFSNGQSVDNVSSLQQHTAAVRANHPATSISGPPLLIAGEGGSFMTDDNPVRTAEQTFRLQPLPAGKLVSIDFRWSGLQIADTRTEWR